MVEVLEFKKFKTDSAIAKPEDEDKVEENCPEDETAAEKVFAIDHILEQIFGLLDTPSLFTCRLVSHRFLNFAQSPLKERIYKSFYYTRPTSKIGEDSSNRSLTQLTEFLVQSLAASEANQSLFSFPCTNFWLYGPQLGNSSIQNFFSIYGTSIEKLKIFPRMIDDTNENIFMGQLCNLLTIQAPHLKNLHLLAVYPTVEWQTPRRNSVNRNPRYRSHSSRLQICDPEFQQISSRVGSLPRTSNLKILKISGHGLGKTLEYLFQLCPKLEEVVFDNSFFYRYLLRPLNRVHLLKSMTFRPALLVRSSFYDNYFKFNMGTMEKISLDTNLRLKELKICFHGTLRLCKIDREFKNKVVMMTSRILEGSKDTLEQLCLSSFTFLSGMNMPSFMPKLRDLEIVDIVRSPDARPKMFPAGFCLAETFPNLTLVTFTVSQFPDFKAVKIFYEFLKYLNFGGPARSLGVKKVVLDSNCAWPKSFKTIPASLYLRIQNCFPNACVEIADQHF